MNKIEYAKVLERYPSVWSWVQHFRDNFPQVSPLTYWVAGGAVRNAMEGHQQPQKDVDFYCRSQALGDRDRGVERLKFLLAPLGWRPSYFSQYSETFTHERIPYKVQIVHHTYESIEECLAHMDWTVAQCAYAEDHFYFGDWTLQDLESKNLRVNKLQPPRNLIPRLVKYVQYGYTPDQGTMSEIIRSTQDSRLSYTKRYYY
jgi:hypothetical protein